MRNDHWFPFREPDPYKAVEIYWILRSLQYISVNISVIINYIMIYVAVDNPEVSVCAHMYVCARVYCMRKYN